MIVAILLAAAPLTTIAEQSEFLRTGRYEEVQRLCTQFPKVYPGKVRCEQFGTTPSGRPMLSLIASSDGTFDAKDIQRKRRPAIVVQGGIHAGEIDGKDAGFWVLRDLLEKKSPILSQLTLIFVPVFNVDGHERFGPNHRPNQRGPQEMGFRVTAQNLNLNRDYLKADAPEMRAMLGLLHRFMPIMYVDLHVTDGAKFQHDVAICFEPKRLGPPSMQDMGRALEASVFAQLQQQGHAPLNFYPSFEVDDDPTSGFTNGWPPPRFGNAYWALHHRFGVLVETHSWRTYKERVKVTFDVVKALLTEAASHARAWQDAAEQADTDMERASERTVALSYDTEPTASTFDFQGYAYERSPSELSGKPWVRYDERTPTIWKVPVRSSLRVASAIVAPKGGYLVPASHAALVEPLLRAHGLRFQRLPTTLTALSVERMHAEASLSPKSVEGHQQAKVKGAWAAATEDFPPGSLVVPIGQPHAEVAMHLLEPTAPDSLASWGFFNAHFEQKEYLEDYLTEAYAREELRRDPELAKAFASKLKDPAFEKDPDARLRFFSARHPSFDQRLGVMPVYRFERLPSR